MALERKRRRASAVGAVDERIRSDDVGRCAKGAGLRQPGVPLAVPGYQQESYPAMVRHADMRKSDESPTIQGPAKRVREQVSPLDPLPHAQAVLAGHAACELQHVS